MTSEKWVSEGIDKRIFMCIKGVLQFKKIGSYRGELIFK